jgi:thyroxine 5-deiodinase
MSDTRWTLEPEIDAYLEVIELPPDEFMQQLAAERAPIEAAAPKPGDSAPAFTAQRCSAEAGLTDDRVSLADYKGHPLALMFGSYTCPIYRGQTERFNAIYTELHERLDFLLVYISEAHPEDGWQLKINHTQNVVYDQPTGMGARAAIAVDCIRSRGITMPVVIDDMENTANKLYSGSPERLYLIDADGIVRHRSPPGPFKMNVIEAWYEALLAGT